jgi:glycosyltransferase involved in cell wall biosynthesis
MRGRRWSVVGGQKSISERHGNLMKLLFITPYFFPARAYGGPIASAGALCRGLAARGVDVRVLTSDADGLQRIRRQGPWKEVWPGVRVHYSRRFLFELWAPGQAWQAIRGLLWADVVYVWGAFFWALPLLCSINLAMRRAVIVSPRGMLFDEALSRKSLKKKLYLALIAPFGRPLFLIHATSGAEAIAIKARWPAAKIAVIPNGVEVPEALPEREHNAAPYLLYLGRLHPYKQVERIIEAFARASAGTAKDGRRLTGAPVSARSSFVGGLSSHWSLFIAGDGEEKYKASLRKLTEELGLTEAVRFVGHADGEEKARLLANAQALILASKSENFGMSVAEALAHGTPCVVTKTAPWEGLESEGCGFWVNDSVEALAEGMNRLMTLSPEERRAMGARGREWMKREFSWQGVAERMISLYESLVEEKKMSVVGIR